MKNIFTLFCLALTIGVFAQMDLSFTDGSDQFFVDRKLGVLPLCVADFNGDFRDDVLTVPEQQYFQLSLQLPDGRYHHIKLDSVIGDVGSVWAITAADINGDGFNEAIIGFARGVYVFKNDLVNNRFVFEKLDRRVWSQNISLADVNKDGVVDAFVCDDVGYNVLYYGNAASNSMDLGFVFDQDTTFNNGGNYGSAFSDIDGDCDLDLYLAKCKQGDTDPTSVDRKNLLYINEDGTWVEDTEVRNLGTGAQSWTGTFGDLDNDLDVDLLITNHTDSNMLLLNDGNGFFEHTFAPGFRSTNFPLQSFLRDFDNNGYLDILITGGKHAIFLNQGNMEFIEFPMDDFCCGNDMLSAGVGDMNSDGFLDIYGNFGNVYNIPSRITDRVFFNDGNDNHWVGFDLLDDSASRNAIGSKVFLYTPSGIQMRELTMGDSYGVGNTLRVHFGMGTETVIDSIVVEWSSDCSRQVFKDITPDSYQIISRSCYRDSLLALNIDFLQLCEGQSAEIRAPEGVSYRWNTGETSQNITVSQPGSYQVTITDDSGCLAISQTAVIARDVGIKTDVVAAQELDIYPCKGDTIELCVNNFSDQVNWSNGLQQRCIQITSSGQYYAQVSNRCQSDQTDTFDIEFIEYPNPDVIDEQYEEATGQLLLTSSDDSTFWYRDSMGTELLSFGGQLMLEDVFMDTSVYLNAEGLVPADTLSGGKLDFDGPGGQNISGLQAGLTFDVFKPFFLQSADVQCFEMSQPILIIQNRFQETLLSKDLSLEEGINTVAINLQIEPADNYSIRFVGDDPKAFRNTGNVSYPYPIGDDYGEVTSGVFTDQEYFFFYNWKLVPYQKECQSGLVPHTFSSVENQENSLEQEVYIYPNPAGNTLNLMVKGMPEATAVKIYNTLGQVALTSNRLALNHLNSLDVSALKGGLYYLQLIDEKGQALAVKSFVRLD